MIAFQSPEMEDKAWGEECFRAGGCRCCEYSFSTLFLWSDTYCQQVARMDGYVLERLCGASGYGYLFPAGAGPLEPVLAALEAVPGLKRLGEDIRYTAVTKPGTKAQLEIATLTVCAPRKAGTG